MDFGSKEKEGAPAGAPKDSFWAVGLLSPRVRFEPVPFTVSRSFAVYLEGGGEIGVGGTKSGGTQFYGGGTATVGIQGIFR